jgi:hypothetical protein
MLQTLKKLVLSSALFSLFLVPLAVPAVVSAQFDPNCGGIDECLDDGASATDPGGEGGEAATTRLNAIIRTVINVFSIVVGVVAVIMIIVGGLKYITSGGDSGNITSAKNTILYAIVGLIVVALAQIIVRFVLERATAT